jgi:hypothetical protein
MISLVQLKSKKLHPIHTHIEISYSQHVRNPGTQEDLAVQASPPCMEVHAVLILKHRKMANVSYIFRISSYFI